MRSSTQTDLFAVGSLPEGLRYEANLLSAQEEAAILSEITSLPFKEFEFHGFLGKRRVVSFGWRYDFNGGGLQKTDDIPAYLLRLREQAAAFAGLASANLQQVLVTEYRPGRRHWLAQGSFGVRGGRGHIDAVAVLVPV